MFFSLNPSLDLVEQVVGDAMHAQFVFNRSWGVGRPPALRCLIGRGERFLPIAAPCCCRKLVVVCLEVLGDLLREFA